MAEMEELITSVLVHINVKHKVHTSNPSIFQHNCVLCSKAFFMRGRVALREAWGTIEGILSSAP